MAEQTVHRSQRQYFSGNAVDVYFGDVWVDQLLSIEYSLIENVAPIFGFQSYTFDRVARGNRYVTGSFSINFTEVGYLQSILDRLSSTIKSDQNENTGYGQKKNYYLESKKEHTIEKLLSGDETDYAEKAEALENTFWGEGIYKEEASTQSEDTYFYRKQSGEGQLGEQGDLKKHGFNILIRFANDAAGDSGKAVCDFTDGGTTLETIVGVHIQSVSKSISPDGNQVIEHYSFIARDLNGAMEVSSLSF